MNIWSNPFSQPVNPYSNPYDGNSMSDPHFIRKGYRQWKKNKRKMAKQSKRINRKK